MVRTDTPRMARGATSHVSAALIAVTLFLLMSCLMIFGGQTQAWAANDASTAKSADAAANQASDGQTAAAATTATKAAEAKSTTTATDAKSTTTATDAKAAVSTKTSDVKATTTQSVTTASTELAELSVTGTNDQTEARKILALVNAERAKTTNHHTGEAKTPGAALSWDYDLEEAALQRAAEISIYYSHTRPDGSDCFTFLDDINSSLYEYYTVGENIQIANYVVNSTAANTGWTNSKGHYENMINDNFTCMGAAFFRIAQLTCWVELFGGNNCAPKPTTAVTGTQTYVVKAEPEKTSLRLTGAGLSGSTKKGATAQYQVVNDNLGWTPAGNGIPVNADSFIWASSNPKAVSVNANGKATAVATGSAALTAKSKTAPSIGVSTTSTIDISYKEGWQVTNGKYWYQLKDGSRYKSCAKAINGSVYVFDADGYRRTGWVQQGSSKYYCAISGVAKKGWATIGGKKYYFNPTSAVMVAGVYKTISGKKYYFNKSGVMQTGWVNVNGKHYMNKSGVMQTGWLKQNNRWYYLNPSNNGRMVAGAYKTISGKTYYFNKSGVMQKGWINVNGKHYMNSSGVMQKGWFKQGGKWYYLNPSNNGRMVASTYKTISGKTYYFDKSGVMKTGWINVNGWHYMNSSGAMVKSAWVGNYWLKANGVMAKSSWVDGGKYYVGSNGVWVKNYKKATTSSGTVYWTPSGSVYHKSASCSTLKRSKTVRSGSIAASGKSRACKVCG